MKIRSVIPAQAGIQRALARKLRLLAKTVWNYKVPNKLRAFIIDWIPAFARMTIMLLLISFYVLPVSAQESSESATLMQKLNALKQDIASKAAEIKNEVNKKVQNKAIIGSILLIDDTEMTIQTLNSTKTIKYDEFTEIIGAKGKEIKVETLEVDDRVAALGDVDDKNNLVAQRLVYLDNFASNSAQLVYGQIQKSTGNTITIQTKDGQTKNLTTNSQTNFFLGNNEASILDAKVEQNLLTRATLQKDGSLKARFIYFIPSMGFTKPIEKSPTPPKSASPSATPKR